MSDWPALAPCRPCARHRAAIADLDRLGAGDGPWDMAVAKAQLAAVMSLGLMSHPVGEFCPREVR